MAMTPEEKRMAWIRGLHVYGGVILAVVGLSFVNPWVGLSFGGVALLVLGLWWVR